MHQLAILPTPETIRFAAHYFADLDAAPFSTSDYSRMKFGDDRVAERYARELADAFAEQHGEILRGRCVVFPENPSVVAAANMMAHHFVARLNEIQDETGGDTVSWSHIHRDFAFGGIYSSATAEERAAALATDRLYFDQDWIGDATIIMLDDVVITGAHENHMEHSVRAAGLNNTVVLAAYARYSGDDAKTEFTLNHVHIRCAADIVALYEELGARYRTTTRSTRLMLDAAPQDFVTLLRRAGPEFTRELYRCAIAKGYAADEKYATNMIALRSLTKA